MSTKQRSRTLTDGWVMVPREPTAEMLEALHDDIVHGIETGCRTENGRTVYEDVSVLDATSLPEAYAAMLAAAPDSALAMSERTKAIEEAANHCKRIAEEVSWFDETPESEREQFRQGAMSCANILREWARQEWGREMKATMAAASKDIRA